MTAVNISFGALYRIKLSSNTKLDALNDKFLIEVNKARNHLNGHYIGATNKLIPLVNAERQAFNQKLKNAAKTKALLKILSPLVQLNKDDFSFEKIGRRVFLKTKTQVFGSPELMAETAALSEMNEINSYKLKSIEISV